MLRRLELALRLRRTWTLSELADELGLPAELVAAALLQLERLGRLPPGALQSGGGQPSAACRSCSLLPACPGRTTAADGQSAGC